MHWDDLDDLDERDVDVYELSHETRYEDEWECAFPGECLAIDPHHQRWECYTVEMAEEAAHEEREKEAIEYLESRGYEVRLVRTAAPTP
jgi:hypothetical protein